MKINRAYRYELDPNQEKKVACAKHAGCARFAFNWGLDLRIKLYESEGKTTNAIEQHRLLNSLKATEFPWMYEVSKCAPQEALRNLDRAFKNFFLGLKKGHRVGFPKFKQKGRHDSFRLTGSIHVEENGIHLPRLGYIRTKEKIRINGHILSATVTREVDRWFVSIHVEEEIEEPKKVIGKPVSIDLGLLTFATLSSGEKIEAPKPLNKHLKRLKRLSKQHSRKVKGSNNRKKSAQKLGRKHRRISNIRKDFIHKQSTKLAKTKPVIVVESLNVKGMMQNKKLSKSIADAGWSQFVHMLEYKTKWYGSQLVYAPSFFASSKICSNQDCRATMETLPLSIREWICPNCSTKHDRDENATYNLLNWYTESSSGINACGDTSSGTAEMAVS